MTDKWEWDKDRDGPHNKVNKKRSSRKREYSPHYEANNLGGYGNPPEHYQFEEGNPGGPGRPRGVGNFETAMRKMMKSKLPLNRNGKTKKISMTEVIAERVKKEIVSGDRRSLELGIALAEKYGPVSKPLDHVENDFTEFTDFELDVFASMLARTFNRPVQMPKEARFEWERQEETEGVYRVFRQSDGHLRMEKIDDAAAAEAIQQD